MGIKEGCVARRDEQTRSLAGRVVELHAVYRDAAVGTDEAWVDDARIRESQKWDAAVGEFDASTFLVELVCGGEVVKAMREFSLFGRPLF